MNSKRAKTVNAKSKELSKKSNLQYCFSNEEVDDFLVIIEDIKTNITLSKKSILTLLEYIVVTYQLQTPQCYEIIEKDSELEPCLIKHEQSNKSLKHPFFIVCKYVLKPLSFICIHNGSDCVESCTNICYFSADGSALSSSIKHIFEKLYQQHAFLENSNIVSNLKSCADINGTRILEIILKCMMERKTSFLQEFQGFLPTEYNENEYIQLKVQILQEVYVKQSFASILNKDKQDNEDFLEEFKKFINETCDAVEDISLCTDYNNIRNEEVERCSKDPNYQYDAERVNEAKKIFLNSKTIKNMTEKYTEKMIDPNYSPAGDEKAFKPEIENKFSTQMKIIRRVLTLIEKCKVKSVRDIAEQLLSKHLGIDYEKIKKLTALTHNTDDTNSHEGDVSLISMRDIQLHINREPAIVEYIVDINVKSSEQILEEIEFPGDNKDLVTNKISFLQTKLQEIQKHAKVWNSKSELDINTWAIKNMRTIPANKLVEAISVFNRANEICTGGHRLRIPQIVTLLTFIYDDTKNSNKICQVQTGEGKTTIIAMLAALKVLSGKKYVDVITSNSVLAAEGKKSSVMFFSLLNMTVADNNPILKENVKRRPCYRADITYGTMGNFQFDYLRHEFEGMETRGNRTFDFLILDEVDCMLIDNASHIAKLSTPFAGMEYLKYVYIKIWVELNQAEEHVANELQKSRNRLLEYLNCEVNNGAKTADEANQELNDFTRNEVNKTHDEIVKFITKANPYKLHIIPHHLEEYCSRSLTTWIDNAIYAKYSCIENVNYIIKEDNNEKLVIPVDYINTGVTMKNTMWSKALHQFLQLKHNLRLTSETLTSSAISNLGYITLYESNVFGLTGTMGSQEEMNVFSQLYNVNFCNIPTYKLKIFRELKGLVIEDHTWASTIATTTINKIQEKRAVLIICNSVQDMLQLEKCFNILKAEECIDEYFQIKIYQDESFCSVTEEMVAPGDIIIATNIAGRGADFKTEQLVEKRGGLHVCVSFCPDNVRVKDQAFFRTSRQGNKGTAQLIIRSSEVSSLGLSAGSSFEDINKRVQELENQKMIYLLNTKVNELKFQDSLCQKFAELNKDNLKTRKNEDGLPYKLRDLKEMWAFWIDAKCFDDVKFSNENADKFFNEFCSECSNLLNGKEIFNPFYTIQLAEYYIQNNKFDMAMQAVNKVLNLEKGDTFHAAYVKKFEIVVEKEKALFTRLQKAISKVIVIGHLADDTDASKKILKSESIAHLENASRAFQIEISYIEENIIGKQQASEDTTEKSDECDKSEHRKFQKCLLPPTEGEKNILFTHIYSRYICLSHYYQNVQGMIKDIEELKGASLAIQCRNTEFLQKLDPNNKNEKEMKEVITKTEISELALLGVETTYALQVVHDVHNTTIFGAQVQIGSGLALLATGVAFPPLFLHFSQLAGTMISEGIMDIVMELITQGVAMFDSAAYVKNKVMSYGISSVTMGISTVLTCEKILKASIKACKNLSELLRSSQRLKMVCEKLAKWIGKIQRWLKKIKYMKEIKYLTYIKNAKNMPFSRVFFPALSNIIKGSIKQVATAIIMEKVVKVSINECITNTFEPMIRNKVLKALENHSVLCKKLAMLEMNEIEVQSNEILNGPNVSFLQEVTTEITKGVVRHYLSPLDNLVIDTTKSYSNVNKFLNHYTDQLYEKLKNLDGKEDNFLDDVINNLTGCVTSRIIGELNNISSKYANLLVVATLDKAIDIASSMNETEIKDTPEKNDDDPWKKLGLDPGASDEEIYAAYLKFIYENRSSDSNVAKTDIDIAKASMEFLMSTDIILSSDKDNCVMDSTATLLKVPVENLSGATGFASVGIGASIDNAASILKKCGLKPSRDVIGTPDSCTADRIDKFLNNQNSDQCIAFVKFNNDGMGHAPLLKKENGQLFVYEHDGSKMTFDDFTKNNPNIEKITFLTGKNLNSKLESATNYINKNKNKHSSFTPLGSTVDSSFYGKTERKVVETGYPGGIELGGPKHQPVLNKMFTALNKMFNNAEEHGLTKSIKRDNKNPKKIVYEVDENAISAKQAQQISNKKRVAVFGADLLSKESDRMLAAVEVTFECGRKQKLITISGDTSIKSCQQMDVQNLTATPGETQELRFKSKIDGFTFHNIGKPEGKVKNLLTGQLTETEYSRSCAAQKALYVVQLMMEKDPTLRVKANGIVMTEVMWSPNKKTAYNPVPSCENCQTTIPPMMKKKK